MATSALPVTHRKYDLMKTFNPASAEPSLRDLRMAARKKMVNGRIHLSVSHGFAIHGKLVDISMSGIGVMLDDPVTNNTSYSVECELFQNGARIVLNARATIIHCVLVSGKGFRVGLQFDALDAGATDMIKKLVG
jgi:hypothetical protein